MYENDTLRSLYDEFVVLEQEIEKVGRNIKVLSIVESQTIAEYEGLKNQELVLMYAEEVEHKFKRTEAQRVAIYRMKYADLRLARYLASGDLKSERDLLSALQAKLQGMQSRKGILISELEISGRRT
jgi:hypothetical protein